MTARIRYSFTATIWQHVGPSAWFFVSLPPEMADEVRRLLGGEEEGWGRMKVSAQVGETRWDTAIWFDTKHNTYLLPLKQEVRKKANLHVNDEVQVEVLV